jgi:hypothetical protein
VSGLAAQVTEHLNELGYQTLVPDNYTPLLAQSRVWFSPGFDAEALEVAGEVDPIAVVEPNPEANTEADIVVVLGASFGE